MLTHAKLQCIDKVTCKCVQGMTPDLGQICLLKQLTELTLKKFVSPSKNNVRNKTKKKIGNCKAFCVT